MPRPPTPSPSPPQEGGPASGEALSFEQALERLEGLVEELESGELPLERALGAFEEGVGLSRRCAEALDLAERRVEELIGDGADARLRPFQMAEDED